MTFFEIDPGGNQHFDRVTVLPRLRGKWLLCLGDGQGWSIPTGSCYHPVESPQKAACGLLEQLIGIRLPESALTLLEGYETDDGAHGALLSAEVPDTATPAAETLAVTLLSGAEQLQDPETQSTLFTRVQYRLNLRTSAGELWDVLDGDRNPTGRTHPRGIPLPPGDYHTVVLVLLQNPAGEFLITRRAPGKGFPNMWEFTGGSALAGDDSRSAAVREVREETGIVLDPAGGVCLSTERRNDSFFDLWHFACDFDVTSVVLQEGETTAARIAAREEIIEMERAGEFIPFPPGLRAWMEEGE